MYKSHALLSVLAVLETVFLAVHARARGPRFYTQDKTVNKLFYVVHLMNITLFQ